MARYLNSKQMRILATTLGAGVLILSFQNCAPPQQSQMCTTQGGGCEKDLASVAPVSGGSDSSQINGGIGSTGGFAPASGTTSGGTSSGGSGGFAPGGTSGGSSTTITTGTGFRLLKNLPSSIRVGEGQQFNMEVSVEGGEYPYSYKWFRNNVEVPQHNGGGSYFAEVADRYQKEGNYHVEIRDGRGTVIRSATANVFFVEPEVGCSEARYVMMSGTDTRTGSNLHELFDNPRGKFLLHEGTNLISAMMPRPSMWNLSVYRFSASNYLARRSLSCQTNIPRINTPRSSTTHTVASGAVIFECRNNKWKFVENTCVWRERSN